MRLGKDSSPAGGCQLAPSPLAVPTHARATGREKPKWERPAPGGPPHGRPSPLRAAAPPAPHTHPRGARLAFFFLRPPAVAAAATARRVAGRAAPRARVSATPDESARSPRPRAHRRPRPTGAPRAAPVRGVPRRARPFRGGRVQHRRQRQTVFPYHPPLLAPPPAHTQPNSQAVQPVHAPPVAGGVSAPPQTERHDGQNWGRRPVPLAPRSPHRWKTLFCSSSSSRRRTPVDAARRHPPPPPLAFPPTPFSLPIGDGRGVCCRRRSHTTPPSHGPQLQLHKVGTVWRAPRRPVGSPRL